MTCEIIFLGIAASFAAAFVLAIGGMLVDIALARIIRAFTFRPLAGGQAGHSLSQPMEP